MAAPYILLEVVDTNDIGMGKLQIAAGLVFEPFDFVVIVKQFIGEKFQRDRLFESAVVRQPNDTHAVEAQHAFEIITVKDALPGNENAGLSPGPLGFAFIPSCLTWVILNNAALRVVEKRSLATSLRQQHRHLW